MLMFYHQSALDQGAQEIIFESGRENTDSIDPKCS
jgi:hypothetical protein